MTASVGQPQPLAVCAEPGRRQGRPLEPADRGLILPGQEQVVGHACRVGSGGAQPGRRLGVDLTTPMAGKGAIQGPSRQGVAEAVASPVLLDHPGPKCEVEVAEGGRLVHAEHGRELAGGEAVTGHRHLAQCMPDGGVQPVQSCPDHLVHALRHVNGSACGDRCRQFLR